MNFSTSDKAVCVDASPNKALGAVPLKRGTVYVVRSTYTDDEGEPGVRLVGVTAGLWHDGTELAFRASRFRHLRTLQAEAGVAAKLAEFRELRGSLE